MPTDTLQPNEDIDCSLYGSNPAASLADSSDSTYLSSESKYDPYWETPDANHDQKMDSDDWQYISDALVGEKEWNAQCDANGDGDASVADLTAFNIWLAAHPGYTYDYYHREPGDPQSVIVGLGSHSIPIGSVINSVKVCWRAKATQYNPEFTLAPLAKVGLGLSGTYSYCTEVELTTDWVNYEHTISRPGGGSWSTDDFNSMTAICTISEQSYLYRGHISKLYVVIDYTTPVGDQIYVIM